MVEGGGILPALAERPGEVADRRPAYLELDVVPRWPWSVAGIEIDRLLVTTVCGVVATAVAQVEPADESDVVVRSIRMPDDEQLLVVATVATHSLIQQHLATRFVHRVDEVQVLLLAEVGLIGVGPPHQPAHVHPAVRQAGKYTRDLGTGAVKSLVRVTPPVGEMDPVIPVKTGETGVEPREVLRTVNQDTDLVAVGVRPPVAAATVDVGRRVGAFVRGQKPRFRRHASSSDGSRSRRSGSNVAFAS